jgi:hypothetical protein
MTHTPNYPLAFTLIILSIALIFFCASKLKEINKKIKENPKRRSISVSSRNKKKFTDFEVFILVGGILFMSIILFSVPLSFLTVSAFVFFSALLIGAFCSK